MNPLPLYGESKPQGRRVWLKRSTIALPLLCLIIFGTIIGANLISNATNAGATGMSLVPIKGSVPGLIKTSTLVGPTDPSQSFSLSVGLQLRNADSLKSYVGSMSRANSITKTRLTPAESAAAYAPLASSQQSVINYLQSYGFTVTKTLSQHLVVDVQGTIADAENAFHIQINNYHSSKGQDFYAPSSEPLLPANLASLVQNIAGLDNSAHYLHSSVQINQPSKSIANISTNSVSCLGPGTGYYLPSQIATAYNLNGFYNANLRGEGQTVGLIEYDDYYSYDISSYTNCYGGNNVPINKVFVDGGPTPYGSYGNTAGPDSLITELDMELILSAAPNLAGLDVYEAPQTVQGSNDMWAQIINSDSISVISTDWGTCEADMASANVTEENSLFTLAAAQGQTIVAAAGDSGTNGCEIPLSSTNPAPFNAVDDPASQPYVTGIGGTSLNLNSDNTYQSETVWNIGAPGRAAGISAAGGGGISNIWPMPSWQQGPGVLNNYSSGTPCGAGSGDCREVPDVSLNAGVTYPIYCNVIVAGCGGSGYNGWYTFGGTDIATPMWAVFMALTNELSQSKGGFNIGFANPYLYQIDQNLNGTSYANDFHDVTSGNNDGLGDSGTTYLATADYDMASGLGSYNAWNLGQDLEKLAKYQNGAPAATTWYFAEGSVGASFTEYLTILNPSNQTAMVTVQYLFTNSPEVSKSYTVAANSRFTIDVNNELGIQPSGPHKSISAIVTSTVPVVVERPMYFDWNGQVNAGTDVVGATTATNTTFYFAQGAQGQIGSTHYSEFITMLNPSSTAAVSVTAHYYNNGTQVGQDTISIPPLQRGTISPSYQGKAAIELTATAGIVAERPIYVTGSVAGISGSLTGAASAVGATSLGGASGSDWLFAEGHTSGTFQENLVLANFTATSTPATIKLEFTNGTVETVQCQVNAESQFSFNVNTPSGNGSACTVKSSGTPTNDVSAEVTATSASIVAERVMYYKYGSIPGTTDVVGLAGSSSQSTYSFAEGYTGGAFTEYLTLQNPTASSEVVALTFFADNMIIQKEITLPPTSRTTILVNNIINPIANAYPASGSHNVSIVIQALNGGKVVAERPEYFNYGGEVGGTDVIGYTGSN